MGDSPQEVQETLALVIDELERMNRFVYWQSLCRETQHPPLGLGILLYKNFN